MTKVQYQTEINAPIEKVYEYYTNPDNIQEAWPQDIVKESENVSGSKSELLNNEEPLRIVLKRDMSTWKMSRDGLPIVDYSIQNSIQGKEKIRKGKHAESIDLTLFEKFLEETQDLLGF